VKANDADPANNVAANVDWAVMNGVISNGSLTIGDADHTGKVVLAGANTYTGSTSINAGTVELTGSREERRCQHRFGRPRWTAPTAVSTSPRQ
jgi:autotransporter-associated beta strand protein